VLGNALKLLGAEDGSRTQRVWIVAEVSSGSVAVTLSVTGLVYQPLVPLGLAGAKPMAVVGLVVSLTASEPPNATPGGFCVYEQGPHPNGEYDDGPFWPWIVIVLFPATRKDEMSKDVSALFAWLASEILLVLPIVPTTCPLTRTAERLGTSQLL
jgi:hypothetical protein